jgi:hypothetical protein
MPYGISPKGIKKMYKQSPDNSGNIQIRIDGQGEGELSAITEKSLN